MDTIELAKAFIRCVEAGDVAGARSHHHEDSRVWHNFDNATQTIDENMAVLERMIEKCTKREYIIHRLEEISTGYLQHHTLQITANDGQVYSTSAAAIVTVRDGKIAMIEEWIDPTPIMPAFAGD